MTTDLGSETAITIELDGRAHALPARCSLAQLVASLGHAPEAVATAVDGRFVPRARRGDHLLQQGEQVLLFQPIVGG